LPYSGAKAQEFYNKLYGTTPQPQSLRSFRPNAQVVP
jgi:hypothetical protein